MDEITTFKINGQRQSITTDPNRPLLDVLREDLNLTGAKYGCGEAQCGACSVLVDGKRVFSCRTPVAQVEGKTVITIEGLSNGTSLHPVQEAFLQERAFQCGYCTSGMIMTAVALLADNTQLSDAEIVSGLYRNICRCCSYVTILKAVKRVADHVVEAK